MALKKEIIREDGVPTMYHRVNALLVHTNHLVTIEVVSYLNEETRNAQKEGLMEPYEGVTNYRVPYDELGSPTITDAYIWLKKHPDFEGAEDIVEDDESVEISGSEFITMLEEVL